MHKYIVYERFEKNNTQKRGIAVDHSVQSARPREIINLKIIHVEHG